MMWTVELETVNMIWAHSPLSLWHVSFQGIYSELEAVSYTAQIQVSNEVVEWPHKAHIP